MEPFDFGEEASHGYAKPVKKCEKQPHTIKSIPTAVNF
jgi:hypothetical protein